MTMLRRAHAVVSGDHVGSPPVKLVMLAAIILILAAAPAAAQSDVAGVLAGKWEGEVYIPGDRTPPSRILELKTVVQENGTWIVKDALYGVTARNMAPIDVKIEQLRDDVTVEFRTGANSIVRLALKSKKNTPMLSGTLTTSGNAQSMGRVYQMELEKNP